MIIQDVTNFLTLFYTGLMRIVISCSVFCFSDETRFHVSRVNRHNMIIYRSENPHVIREYIRDSPKINVWCGHMHDQVIGPFFFLKNQFDGNVYLDMLINNAIPQLQELQLTITVQQDGAPHHWALEVRRHLNETFPNRWIGIDGSIPWPSEITRHYPLIFLPLRIC